MSEHQRYEELLSAHALGALDGDEANELERHLAAGCATCEAELRRLSLDLEAIAGSVPPVEPSPEIRARLLDEIGGPRPAPRRPVAPWLLAAAAVLVLAWGGWMLAGMRGRLEALTTQNAALLNQLQGVQVELAATRTELEVLARANSILAAPETGSVVLAGLEGAPEAAARTFVNPVSGMAVFYGYRLPELEPEKTYQLWLIAGGTPVSAGTFGTDPTGSSVHFVDRVENPGAIEAWAVSVEPAGGVPQPTGDIVLMGQIGP